MQRERERQREREGRRTKDIQATAQGRRWFMVEGLGMCLGILLSAKGGQRSK